MRLLVIGKTGQLARALAEELDTGPHSGVFLDREACDLSASPDDISAALQSGLSESDAVIIAAAYTAVDKAEDDLDAAHAVNGRAPGAIASAAAERGLPVVHVSTDYVFDGQASKPYATDTPIDPLNAYGRTKAEGEAAVFSAQPRSAILRTSWVYDGTGRNFLTTMLRLGETRDRLTVVADQVGRPTYARDLARACVRAVERLARGDASTAGVFHVSNGGEAISWAEFARAIFEATEAEREHAVTVSDIPSSDYPTPARRPSYSVMDISKFERTFDMRLPDWQSGLDRALAERDAG